MVRDRWWYIDKMRLQDGDGFVLEQCLAHTVATFTTLPETTTHMTQPANQEV